MVEVVAIEASIMVVRAFIHEDIFAKILLYFSAKLGFGWSER